MLNGATPLFAAVVASGLARRAPSQAVALGLIVGFLGAILIALPGITGPGGGADHTAGVLMILIALASYGFAINLARPLQQRNGALPVIWRALGVALILTAPLGLRAVLDAHWTMRAVASLAALGVFGACVANVLSATAAGRISATAASATNFIVPVVALALGVGVRHEHVAWLSIAGAAVCLTSAWLIRRARMADARAEKALAVILTP